MAFKVVVPADFGIENLHCEFHGNVLLKLQGGKEMRANSLILSYHSSVFVHLFLELHQSVLEMEDFGGEAVRRFLGALYSGEIKLERNLFRDVNKMCHVFKVDWLSGRCRDYFISLIDSVTSSTDYQTLLFLSEEARYCKTVIKCNDFIDRVIQKMCGIDKDKRVLFVVNYMKNYAALETSQLDLILQITKNNPASLLKIIKRNIEQDGQSINLISRYLLENIDLCKCMYECGFCCEELYDALDHAKRISKSDAVFVNSLYRRVIKGLNKTLPCEDHKAISADKQAFPSDFQTNSVDRKVMKDLKKTPPCDDPMTISESADKQRESVPPGFKNYVTHFLNSEEFNRYFMERGVNTSNMRFGSPTLDLDHRAPAFGMTKVNPLLCSAIKRNAAGIEALLKLTEVMHKKDVQHTHLLVHLACVAAANVHAQLLRIRRFSVINANVKGCELSPQSLLEEAYKQDVFEVGLKDQPTLLGKKFFDLVKKHKKKVPDNIVLSNNYKSSKRKYYKWRTYSGYQRW